MNIRSLMVLTALLFATISANAQVFDGTPFYCTDCRSFNTGPGASDAQNFALNQVWGPTGWMNLDQADAFNLADSFGNTLNADLNLQINGLEISINEYIRLMFPTEILIQIILRDENGNLVQSDTLDPNKLNFPLPVGDGTSTGGSSGSGSGSSSGSSGGGGDSSGGEGSSGFGGGGGGAGAGGGAGGSGGSGGGTYCGPGTDYICIQY